MKLLLVMFVSVLAVSCSDFESENYGKAPVGGIDAFEKLEIGSTFGHKDPSKELFIDISVNKNEVMVDKYKKANDGTVSQEESMLFVCAAICATESKDNKMYKVITINDNQNEILITNMEVEGNKASDEEMYELVR